MKPKPFAAVSIILMFGILPRSVEGKAERVLSPDPCARGEAREESMVRLPAPSINGGMALTLALAERRSVRQFEAKPVSLANVAQLLWAAQGVTRPMPQPPSFWNQKWGVWGGGLRTAPSAGALYPLEVYLLASAVDGLDRGVYQYVPGENGLVKVGVARARELAKAALGQEDIAQAPVVLVFSGVYQRTSAKYGERAPRYVHIEVGAAAENLMLQATALGLGSVFIGAFDDEAVRKTLMLPADYAPLGLVPVGYAVRQ